MSTDPFTDELLSAIIDGEADEETVASVNADPVASARLARMRQAVELVAEPVPEATPERRSASIAAAMAAATSAAPEVASLAAARHQRDVKAQSLNPTNRQWLAVVAAAVALIVAIPLVLQFRESAESADTATSAADDAADTGSASFEAAADETMDDSADDASDAMEQSEDADADATALDAEAAAAQAEADTGDSASADDDAMEESDDGAADGSMLEERLRVRTMASNVEIIDEFIALGTLTPVLTLDEVLSAGVSAACADTLLAETPAELLDSPMFDIAYLDADGLTEPRLLIVQFSDDGTTTTLDAEDCAQLG